MFSSNCCFLTCTQISQEASKVVWYSHLFQNFPQFIVIHTAVKKCPTSKIRETPVRWLVLRESLRRQADWNNNHRKLNNLITWTTALPNSMKLSYAMQGWTGHGGEFWQNVVHWKREWQTALLFLPCEPNDSMKRQRNQRSNCQHLLDHWKSKRVLEKHLFLLYWLCQSLWLHGCQYYPKQSTDLMQSLSKFQCHFS